MVRRWQQLPLDHALLAYPELRDLVQLLADDTAGVTGKARIQVPDLGPAVVMDQLRVMVHDWRRAGLAEDVLEKRTRRSGQVQDVGVAA